MNLYAFWNETPPNSGRRFYLRRHCEERSDEAIQTVPVEGFWVASLRSQ
ncbi:hypothetical protein ABIB94_000536 [Bradyrhizobium sp. JR7.2]